MMRIKIIILFCNSLLLFAFSGCEKDSMCNCLKGTGDVITETRSIEPFRTIETYKNVKVFIVQDSVCYLKVSAGKHLIDGISATVSNNVLLIENKNRCNWLRSFKNNFVVEVHTPVLNHIINNSSDDIIMLNKFFTDSLSIDCHDGLGTVEINVQTPVMWTNLHTGIADVKGKGTVGVNYVYAASQGSVDYAQVETGYTFITNKGTNDCYIHVQKELNAEIFYVGNIYYKGNPYKVNSVISGTGNLIHQP